MSTYHFEQTTDLSPEIKRLIQENHVRDEAERGLVCNYKKFALLAKNEAGEVLGVIQAYTAFAEVYVDDILVLKKARGKGIGTKLLEELYQRFNGKGYNNINLVTSHGQAPEFYRKCGFTEEFVRINTKNPSLSKSFFIKYFDDADQHQGVLKKE